MTGEDGRTHARRGRPGEALRDTATCEVEQCEGAYYAKGLCQPHYARARRNNGDPLAGNRGSAISARDADDGTKRCLRCATVKPTDDFGRDRGRPDGLTFYCLSCIRDYEEAQRLRDPEVNAAARRRRSRKHQLRTLFGLTLEEYEERLAAQHGVCALCGKPEKRRTKNGILISLPVDHDHETGHVRDLLCDSCNSGLGRFHDDPQLLRAAADYVERHRAAAAQSS